MIRVRLKFDSSPVSYARKCWFVFDGEKCRLVGDVSHLIASHFKLEKSLGIQVRESFPVVLEMIMFNLIFSYTWMITWFLLMRVFGLSETMI